MRTIEQTGQFRRDYKREAKGSNRQTLENEFIAIIQTWQTTSHCLRRTATTH